MARKKAVTKPEIVVLVAFNGMYQGDRAEVEMTDTVRGWIDAGLVRLTEAVNSGKNPTRPRAVEQDDPGSLAFGAGDSGTSGDEPSQGFGAGSYGAPQG